MKYKIKQSIKNLKTQSYLKDEEKSLQEDLIDCSLGINPCGFTPYITKEIYAQTFDLLENYPSHPYTSVCKKICDYFQDIATLNPSQISMQSGSMSALYTINNAFLEENTHVLAPKPCFSSYITHARSCGAIIDYVPLREEDNFTFPVDAYIQALQPYHRLAYIDNPNNPTGQAFSVADIRKILTAALEKEIVVIIDEAYGDFIKKSESAVSLINKFENLIVVRTFSKGFGLGALRAGYIVMPQALVSDISNGLGEMNLTTPAEKMIPLVLSDPDFLTQSQQLISENKKSLINSLQKLRVSTTTMTVPIALYYTKKDVDLGDLFWKQGIRIENGGDFEGIGKRHVRVRVPKDITKLLQRIKNIEAEL